MAWGSFLDYPWFRQPVLLLLFVRVLHVSALRILRVSALRILRVRPPASPISPNDSVVTKITAASGAWRGSRRPGDLYGTRLTLYADADNSCTFSCRLQFKESSFCWCCRFWAPFLLDTFKSFFHGDLRHHRRPSSLARIPAAAWQNR